MKTCSEAELKSIKTRLDYIEKSIDKTEIELNRRLTGMNEFREALKDQNNNFITRVEYDAKHELVNTKLDGLAKLVYIGLGIFLVIDLLLHFVVK